ncbi:hypothetical protein NIES4101_54170 [Calothrix sp. NIES-4101]|nr:hypothetical protein NIES4101_54170 [Calothrix sp. NIES-4101]
MLGQLFGQSRRISQEEAVTDYQQESQANSEIWRWRIPNTELNLTLKDESDRSIIFLPQRSSFGRNIAVLLGYFMFALAILTAIESLIKTGNLGNAIAGFTFLAGLGCVFAFTGSQVIRIELTTKDLTIVRKFAFFFEFKNCYLRHAVLDFSGRYQAILMVEYGAEPDFYIWIKRKRNKSQKFITSCNKLQGSWLVYGLQLWREYNPNLAN